MKPLTLFKIFMVFAGVQQVGNKLYPKERFADPTSEFKQFSLPTISSDIFHLNEKESGKLESSQQASETQAKTNQSEKYSIHKTIQATVMKFFTKRSRLQF